MKEIKYPKPFKKIPIKVEDVEIEFKKKNGEIIKFKAKRISQIKGE